MEDPESAEGMDAQNREKVRAAACFENLAAGEYVLKRDDASERIRRVRSDSV